MNILIDMTKDKRNHKYQLCNYHSFALKLKTKFIFI